MIHFSSKPILALFALSLSPLAALGATAPLATVNGKAITLENFTKHYEESTRFLHFKMPSKKSVLDDMIKRELAIQEAKKTGLDKDPEIQERMDAALAQALLDRKLSKEIEKISVTDSDAKDYYAKNPEIRSSHIFIAVRPGAPAEEEKKAMEKIETIQKKYLGDEKMSFAEVAQRYSEGPAAPMGGDIDYQTRDRLDASYYDAALKLRTPGKMSGVIRSPFGFHIIKLTAIRTWDEVDKGKVKRLVFDSKRQDLLERYLSDLRRQAKVSVNSDLLKE